MSFYFENIQNGGYWLNKAEIEKVIFLIFGSKFTIKSETVFAIPTSS